MARKLHVCGIRRAGHRLAVLLVIAIGIARGGQAAGQTCVGDCNGDGTVSIDELILGVNIALGERNISDCSSLDDGQGMVTVDRLIAAVNSVLCDCGPCGTGTATPTTTGSPATPTVTPSGGEMVSMWTVDNYDVTFTDCNGVVRDAVVNGLEAVGPDFTVRQTGDQVEIEDGMGNTVDGTADPDGTVHVQRMVSNSFGPCDYDVTFDSSANLSQSPTTATYDGHVNFSGFCVGFSDCDLQVTSRWRRIDTTAASR